MASRSVWILSLFMFFDISAAQARESSKSISESVENKDHRISPGQVRNLIDQYAGGIQKLIVPSDNTLIPVPPAPRNPDGSVNNRYDTTEAKRFLGKMLFHDPIRTARVNKGNFEDGKDGAQPSPLPSGTAFGGTLDSSDPNIQAIVDATKQTGSCGSCHIGEAAGKAGQLLNFNTGGEGRGYTDKNGIFFPRRRPQSILLKVRDEPIFQGDLLVDALPTLTDIDCIIGQSAEATIETYNKCGIGSQPLVTTPANFYHDPKPIALLATGRLDQLDSVGRESPSMIGFAFNNRLLFGGFAGEPLSTLGSLNPLNDVAQENLTLLLLDAHRMLNFQSAELRKIRAYVQLFREAFEDEARADDLSEAGVPEANRKYPTLITDVTILRATSTFLRTVVTRNTLFDHFLAGDDKALTRSQLRGAKLFFTPATNGVGGAGCVSCHSGPMLNKQLNDPDVAGVGQFVEENFFNIGIGDHPVQAENAAARGRLDPNKLDKDGFPYHAEDTGREEVTHNPKDAFKFRSLTLRQLKDGRNFFHNGSFNNVRDVVNYFNFGIPQDPTAGAASTLSDQFTHPKGAGYSRGLGLSKGQVNDLTDFLENALYDPAFVNYDPRSSTDTLQPNKRDLTYSRYHIELAELGAIDGLMPSGLAVDDNDPLARRDQGLEFLDVTSQLSVTRGTSYNKSDDDNFDNSNRKHRGRQRKEMLNITNTSPTLVDTHLLIVIKGLSNQVRLANASGSTTEGNPYLRVFLKDGVLTPGHSITEKLIFKGKASAQPLKYTLTFLSGQGKP